MTHTYRCFVPNLLVDIIQGNVSQGKDYIEPLSFFLNGVCLIVDISGFTRLSGEFCKIGRSGIDQLQLATNGYMGALVEIIHSFGGEIVKFAGDAIICIFAVTTGSHARNLASRLNRALSNGSLNSEGYSHSSAGAGSAQVTSPSGVADVFPLSAETVLNAMQCAQKLRDVQTEKLSVHVAMSCGEMCFGILGGVENRWECLISGPCIHELSQCLDDAPSKTAVISAACGNVLSKAVNHRPDGNGILKAAFDMPSGTCKFVLQELVSGNFRVEETYSVVAATAISRPPVALRTSSYVEERTLAIVKQFVPVPIADELEGGTGLNYMAEMREVTTMFMKWDSYDVTNKHRDLLQLQCCFYEAQKVLQSTGAYLRQFLVDDKGCVLIACWGMPNLSYLDNAHRALSAAAQIRRKLCALDMQCSFGITTGDVYCGTVGSPLRMEYAAIGSVVNMAARLMGKAHGGIFVDSATYSRLPDTVLGLLIALEPMTVKGREEPIEVFAYMATDSIHVQEKVVEDQALPPAKREIMIKFLEKMQEDEGDRTVTIAPIVAKPTVNRSWRAWFEGRGNRARASSTFSVTGACSIPLQLLLIKGHNGSGRTTVVKWIRKQAQDRSIPVCCVKVSTKDAQTDFLVWKRLFQQLVPRDLFLSADVQRAYVQNMLREIYPDISRSVRMLKFAVLKTVLGVTCSFTRVKNSFSKAWFSHRASPASPKLSQLQASTIYETLFDVFAYLLNSTTSLLIIENVENADERSLRVLCSLLKLNTRSAVVLTALKIVAPDPLAAKLSPFRTRTVRQDALGSTMWTKKYKCIIQCHRCTYTLFLEPFRAAEIERMLAAALKVTAVPAELTQLVQDFSGGTCFWVLELLQFITEHGAEQFMSAIGESEEHEDRAAHDNAPRRRSIGSSTSAGGGSGAKLKSVRSVPRQSGSLHRHNTSGKMDKEAPHQLQLDKLILCRFGNLTQDVQRVLRAASIIGMTFSRAALFAILPAQLKVNLFESVQALVDSRWIYLDLDDDSVYQFAHEHTQHLIYELTPSSERNNTHRQIAMYLEETYPNDPAQYCALSYHYQQCDPAKALAYTAKATDVLLKVDSVFDFADCLDLLAGAVDCCSSDSDVATLLALVNQAQIAIVMFCMYTHLQQKGGSMKLPSRAWFCLCAGSCATVVPTEDDHHHDHDHDHDHEHEHEHDHHAPGASAPQRKCPCKVEEDEDAAAAERSITVSERDSLDSPAKVDHEADRTKKAFLGHLREISMTLKEMQGTRKKTSPVQ